MIFISIHRRRCAGQPRLTLITLSIVSQRILPCDGERYSRRSCGHLFPKIIEIASDSDSPGLKDFLELYLEEEVSDNKFNLLRNTCLLLV